MLSPILLAWLRLPLLLLLLLLLLLFLL